MTRLYCREVLQGCHLHWVWLGAENGHTQARPLLSHELGRAQNMEEMFA